MVSALPAGARVIQICSELRLEVDFNHLTETEPRGF